MPSTRPRSRSSELCQADEVILTGTTIEVMPVVAIDGRPDRRRHARSGRAADFRRPSRGRSRPGWRATRHDRPTMDDDAGAALAARPSARGGRPGRGDRGRRRLDDPGRSPRGSPTCSTSAAGESELVVVEPSDGRGEALAPGDGRRDAAPGARHHGRGSPGRRAISTPCWRPSSGPTTSSAADASGSSERLRAEARGPALAAPVRRAAVRRPLPLPPASPREARRDHAPIDVVVPGRGDPGQGDVSRPLDRRGRRPARWLRTSRGPIGGRLPRGVPPPEVPEARARPQVQRNHPQGEEEGADGPGREGEQGDPDDLVAEARAFEDHGPQGVEQVGQRQGLDEGLDRPGEAVGREEQAGEDPHRQHHQVHQAADGLGGLGPAGDQQADPGERQRARRSPAGSPAAGCPGSASRSRSSPSASSTPTSGIRNVSLAPRIASRKLRRGIGVAMNRFNSLAIRKFTIRNPTPQSPPPIVFWPMRPGIRKSM